jgi:isocitrate lyase
MLKVQRQEIRKGVACVKHQRMAGSNLGDDHKTFFAGDKALKADGAKTQVISLKVKKYRTRTSIRK